VCVCETRILFERADELKKPALISETFCEDVEMVRHKTIGVDRKLMALRGSRERCNKAFNKQGIVESGMAAISAHGHKVDALADVVLRRQTYALAKKRHRCLRSTQIRVAPGFSPASFGAVG
jgi:hypothetical protein